jgi:hypothetical protein
LSAAFCLAAAAPVPAATDPTIRLKALQLAQQHQQQSDDAAAAAKQNAADKIAAQQAAQVTQQQTAAAAGKIADNFDYSVFQGKPSTSNFLNPNADPTGQTERFLIPKINDAAAAAGIKPTPAYYRGALQEIQRRRDQTALDAALQSADPDTVKKANVLAAQLQARQSVLPTAFGTSSVGATDYVVPNSGQAAR